MIKEYLFQNKKENMEIMEALLDEVFNGVMIVDDKGKVILCNKSIEKIIGQSKNQILNSDWCKFFQDGIVKNAITKGTNGKAIEVNIHDRNLFIRCAPLKIEGRLIGNIIVFKDVTFEKDSSHQLRKLKESIEMIEELLDSAYNGMVLVDEEGRIVKWNYEKLMGIKEEDVLNKYVQDVIENTRLHIVAKTGEKELCEVQKIKGHDMITSRIPIIKDGKIIGAAGTVLFKDVKELKALVQKMEVLQNTVHRYKGEIVRFYKAKYTFDNIITQNKRMIYLKEIARRAAESNSTVLIQGESGTGKELFAHGIHNASLRRYGPFITINCAAIPKELLESELFGYEGGSFTGAKKEGKIGKFELANGGTILLDEIGSMPLEMQAKLLRVLESKEFERIGGTTSIHFDAKVIASTNENLLEAIKEGRFRKDLFYRLNVIRIEIPPLRERTEDIPVLIEHIVQDLTRDLNITPKVIAPEAIDILTKYKWPGNVREMRNAIERALNLTPEDVIYPQYLPEYILRDFNAKDGKVDESLLLKDVVAKAEIQAIIRALQESKGNRTLAAEKLGIHRTALYKKIEAYGLDILKQKVKPNMKDKTV